MDESPCAGDVGPLCDQISEVNAAEARDVRKIPYTFRIARDQVLCSLYNLFVLSRLRF